MTAVPRPEPADPLAGYETGPDATVRATAAARERVGAARAAVLVEGVSDQIAVEAAARALGIDLTARGVVVMPIGGAHAIGRVLAELPAGIVVAMLCDAGEESFVRRAIAENGVSETGVYVCVDDLEDELLRAAGRDLVEQVVAAQDEARSFATMRAQQQWRDAPFDAQFRRFCGSRSQRKHRYAAALVEALGPDRIPAPLRAALDACTG